MLVRRSFLQYRSHRVVCVFAGSQFTLGAAQGNFSVMSSERLHRAPEDRPGQATQEMDGRRRSLLTETVLPAGKYDLPRARSRRPVQW